MSAMVICRYRPARRLSPSYSILACPYVRTVMYFATRGQTDADRQADRPSPALIVPLADRRNVILDD